MFCNRGHWCGCTVEWGSTPPCRRVTVQQHAALAGGPHPCSEPCNEERHEARCPASAAGWNGTEPGERSYGTERLQVATAFARHGARHAAGPAGRRLVQPGQGLGPAQGRPRVCGAGRGAPQGAGAGVDQRRHEGVPHGPDARKRTGRPWRAAFRPVDRHSELGRCARAELRRLRPHRHDRRICGGWRHGMAHRLHGEPRRIPRRQAPACRADRRVLDRRMPCAAPRWQDGGRWCRPYQRTVPRHDGQAAARRARRDHLARHHEQRRPVLGVRALRRAPARGGRRRADSPD